MSGATQSRSSDADGEKTTRSGIARRLRGFAPLVAPADGLRAATVVIAVTEQNGQYGIWLTKRSAQMREHPGQYVLPGGRAEPGEDYVTAGLRELVEELGLSLTRDHVLGRLDDYVTKSGYVIAPIVCWAANGVDTQRNPDEVASVHFVSFAELLATPRFEAIQETDRRVIQFPLLGILINAPTGAVLYQFAEVVLRGRPTRVSGLEEP
ncbi:MULTISPECIES: CoA pyrophosphatase [unclassified Mycobacterium]|uniref:NUDIX hydrolase n=1 Tax=unclassified Mycobacterium TaxID=2642494 RepID=UPI0029C86356|nr:MULTISPECIES: CoA pyrophosphatase [unclassified Mycobacterium]